MSGSRHGVTHLPRICQGLVTVFGSLNIDNVYRLPHINKPAETQAALSHSIFPGGKGLNQAVAIRRAGVAVDFIGCVGNDSDLLVNVLDENEVLHGSLLMRDLPSGHAIIQVQEDGQNSIIVSGGANQTMTEGDLQDVLGGDNWLLLQNETSCVGRAIEIGSRAGMRVAFNPSPCKDIETLPLGLLSLLCVNEVEGELLTGEKDPLQILRALRQRCPEAILVLTLGALGAYAEEGNQQVYVPSRKVEVVDTTAAGDTFLGYLLAGLTAEQPLDVAMDTAARAAEICITRPGAIPSIPLRSEVVTA